MDPAQTQAAPTAPSITSPYPAPDNPQEEVGATRVPDFQAGQSRGPEFQAGQGRGPEFQTGHGRGVEFQAAQGRGPEFQAGQGDRGAPRPVEYPGGQQGEREGETPKQVLIPLPLPPEDMEAISDDEDLPDLPPPQTPDVPEEEYPAEECMPMEEIDMDDPHLDEGNS